MSWCSHCCYHKQVNLVFLLTGVTMTAVSMVTVRSWITSVIVIWDGWVKTALLTVVVMATVGAQTASVCVTSAKVGFFHTVGGSKRTVNFRLLISDIWNSSGVLDKTYTSEGKLLTQK